MAFDADEEILQDFLVEAGEILEQLSEQLVELEQEPDNKELLNAIFRGFHTVKGGAGFLQLDALVECCHVAENVFDILRNGKRSIDSELMDVVLQALDTINAQFEQVRGREEPTPADPGLIQALAEYAQPAGATTAPQPPPSAPAPAVEDGDITDDEFEALLDALEDEKSAEPDTSQSDEISDDEFESLLDELHGSGKHQGVPGEGTANEQPAQAPADPASPASDEISDDEFEALLDQLHGKGRFDPDKADESGQAASVNEPSAAAAAPQATPAAKPAPPRETPAGDTTVRVDTRRLDDIMNMVGELVLIRNRMKRLSDEFEDERVQKTVANLDVVTGDLQSAVMHTRMQPIKKVFGRFPRVVRDLARNLKKEIQLTMSGEDTDLDKNLVEALADPLVHLVRNAVDHGIELPDEREARGKPRCGTVRLTAEQEGDHIRLMIEDDGAGMDAEVLRRKAVEKGLLDRDAADRLTDHECYNLIFAPGFSTKEAISDVSGRGVGMDVVKTKISQLNGSLHVDSELGAGSRIVIKVPLTLAIMPTLMVKLEGQPFALPLVNVVEIFHLDLTRKNIVDGRECIVVREQVYPLFHLKRWLVRGASADTDSTDAHVVIVAIGTKQVGFVVDQLVGQEEVVIKPLGKMLHGTAGLAGATITGDGRIALIIDVPSLLQHYA